MGSVELLDQVSKYLLYVIESFCVVRLMWLAFRGIYLEETDGIKGMVKNTIGFAVTSLLAYSLATLLIRYFH